MCVKEACGFASGTSTKVFCGHFAHISTFECVEFLTNFFMQSFLLRGVLIFMCEYFGNSYIFLSTYASSVDFYLQHFSQFQLSFNVLNVIIIRFLNVSWGRACTQTHKRCIYV